MRQLTIIESNLFRDLNFREIHYYLNPKLLKTHCPSLYKVSLFRQHLCYFVTREINKVQKCAAKLPIIQHFWQVAVVKTTLCNSNRSVSTNMCSLGMQKGSELQHNVQSLSYFKWFCETKSSWILVASIPNLSIPSNFNTLMNDIESRIWDGNKWSERTLHYNTFIP